LSFYNNSSTTRLICHSGYPLFFCMTFPLTKMTQIHNQSALNQRQLWIVTDSLWWQKISCLLKVVASCPQLSGFNTKWIICFTLRLINCTNSYKNYATLQSFSITFHNLCYFPWLSKPGKWPYEIPWLSMIVETPWSYFPDQQNSWLSMTLNFLTVKVDKNPV